MKKIIYISAIICLNMIVLGGLLIVLHKGSGSWLVMPGILLLSFWVLPAAFINSYKSQHKSLYLYIIGYICVLFFLISTLLNLYLMPFHKIFLYISILLPIILFLPAFYYQQRKEKVEKQSNLIGVMFMLTYYALISAMLSTGVNKNFINSFTVNIEQLKIEEQAIIAYNNSEYQSNEGLKNKEQQLQIKNTTNDFTTYIRSLKTELIAKVEGIDTKVADTISVYRIANGDLLDIFMQTKASELKNEIDKYKNQLLLLVNNNEQAKASINKILSMPNRLNPYSNQSESWETYEFRNSILIASIYKLSNLEMYVRLAELEAIKVTKEE